MPHDPADGREHDIGVERCAAVGDDPIEIVLNLAGAIEYRMVQYDDQFLCGDMQATGKTIADNRWMMKQDEIGFDFGLGVDALDPPRCRSKT
ncbi:hypothetical protein ACFSOZ_33905 [Mesorhizobium newzealandense]|uniref:Uncharacterized protein n=1 Tax=Mesorhizobium newzealandense TaxID=1300302 RepID=A0ABW4ULJ9_9HYPH